MRRTSAGMPDCITAKSYARMLLSDLNDESDSQAARFVARPVVL